MLIGQSDWALIEILPMAGLKIASVRFGNASGDKAYNLSVIQRLSAQAAARGCQVVAFHECSISGYTFASKLCREELLAVADLITLSGCVVVRYVVKLIVDL
jgi:predicted amidohydrolase